MDDKVIVTNLSALRAKYGAKVSAIQGAVKKLIAADKKRGIQTRLVALDDAAGMKRLKAPRVTNAADTRQNKRAVDGVYKALLPDYLLILGSVDVVPHQDLKNPVYDPHSVDTDPLAWGDIPYACEAAYSQKPETFVGPTRVVGRLPDLTGATDPAYLVDLLATATSWTARPLSDYAGFFGLSAAAWEGSTRMSLDSLFGSNKGLLLSPKKGPKWTKTQLAKRLHFINCHGAESNPTFLGQLDEDFPVAHESNRLANKILEGTVASVECCYGAELYDSFVFGPEMCIAQAYLQGKAYGYFGSTTIAYGPVDTNGAADLICQFFLKYVLEGASLGRAALQARQDFASSSPQLDPVDLKTIAQFNLLGDPSIHPVDVPPPHSAVGTMRATTSFAAVSIERTQVRQQLHAKGVWLAKNQPVASSTPTTPKGASILATLKKITDKIRLTNVTAKTYALERTAVPMAMAAKAVAPSAFHVLMGDAPVKRRTRKGAKAAPSPVRSQACIVAKEVNGKIVSFRELYRR